MVNVYRSKIQGRLRNLKALCLHDLQISETNTSVLISIKLEKISQSQYLSYEQIPRAREAVSLFSMKMLNSQVFIPQKDVIILCNNVWVHKPLCKPPDALPEHMPAQWTSTNIEGNARKWNSMRSSISNRLLQHDMNGAYIARKNLDRGTYHLV